MWHIRTKCTLSYSELEIHACETVSGEYERYGENKADDSRWKMANPEDTDTEHYDRSAQTAAAAATLKVVTNDDDYGDR